MARDFPLEVLKICWSHVDPVPDLLQATRVCRRWKIEIGQLDLKKLIIPPRCKCAEGLKGTQLQQLLQRAWFRNGIHVLDTEGCDQKLSKAIHTNLSLATSPLRSLRVLRVNNTQGGKVLSTVLSQCKQLQELHVSFCEKPSITGKFPINSVESNDPNPNAQLALSALHLNGCWGLRSAHVRKVLRSAPQLRSLCLTGSGLVEASTLRDLTQYCPRLQRLILSQCGIMNDACLENFLHACADGLQWLDLSFCSGWSRLHAGLHTLRVAVFDHTAVSDEGLLQLSVSCSRLHTFSVAHCRRITDVGILAVVHACVRLRKCRLTATTVTEPVAVCIYEDHPGCMTELNSCRGVTRETRRRTAIRREALRLQRPARHEEGDWCSASRVSVTRWDAEDKEGLAMAVREQAIDRAMRSPPAKAKRRSGWRRGGRTKRRKRIEIIHIE